MWLGGYRFEGPHEDTSRLIDRTGVYVILSEKYGKFKVLDVGQSAQLKSRIESHDRKDCWRRNSEDSIHFAVYYTVGIQEPGRREIESQLREKFRPPCGKE